MNIRGGVITKALSEKLRELRLDHNYTQKYVSGYLNLSRQGYAHYEGGTRVPSAFVLSRLAVLYGIPIHELFEEDTNSINNVLVYETDLYLAPTLEAESLDTSLQKKIHESSKHMLPVYITREEANYLKYFRSLDKRDRKDILLFTKCKLKRT